jgi:hypothetical protein
MYGVLRITFRVLILSYFYVFTYVHTVWIRNIPEMIDGVLANLAAKVLAEP